MAAKTVAAWQWIQASPYYKAMKTVDQDSQCAVGETFFGELSYTDTGSFICNQSNGLYVPAHACQEVAWFCVAPQGVQCRHSPEMSDRSESHVQHGTRISALPVLNKPGWLQEAATRMYLPMTHPSSGDALFTKVNPVTQAAPTAVVMNPPVQQMPPSAVVLAPTHAPPPTVPAGSTLIMEKYNGTNTVLLGCLAGWVCFPCGCIVCCMELDERQCWLAPDGRRYDLAGKRIVEG